MVSSPPVTEAGTPWTDAPAPAVSGGGAPSRFYLRGPTLIVAAAAIVLGGVGIVFGAQARGDGLADPLALKGTLLVVLGVVAGLWPDIARLRYRRQLRAAGGEPWRASELWAPVTTLHLERRVNGSPGARRRSSVGAPVADARLVQGRRCAVLVGFASFPLRLGERAQLQLQLDEALRSSGDLSVSLECVSGKLSRRAGGWESAVAHILLPADTWPVPAMEGVVAMEFDVPPDVPATDLLSLPAHNWFVVVSLESSTGAWFGRVPAPVFGSAAAPS